jgi:3-deoxy-D-manno-octulosonate 8-phosphate phosphatase (KDO 8-P phosphatase)
MYEQITWLVVDVDGTMTDGSIYYDEHGNELKKFNTRDAFGFFAAKRSGIRILVATGRQCAATQRRLMELQVDHLYQGIHDKYALLAEFFTQRGVTKEQIGYIGDDINDLKAMDLATFVACPKDACREVLHVASYVSFLGGGYGAVRDAVEYLLESRGESLVELS